MEMLQSHFTTSFVKWSKK